MDEGTLVTLAKQDNKHSAIELLLAKIALELQRIADAIDEERKPK